ncbi:MAG: HAD family hydrolase [Clostridioides sp.]|nr:HAD family hydrolase [Clostridioides sp.]
MRYKLVVSDMDGTLLDGTQEITTQNKDAIDMILENDMKFAIASGRMYCSAKNHVDYLNTDIPIIACNGAMIKSTSGELIYSNTIETEVALKILEILDKHDVYYQAQHSELLFSKDLGSKGRGESQKLKAYMKTLDNVVTKKDFTEDILKNNILKFTVMDEANPERLVGIREELSKIKGIKMTSSMTCNIEIMSEDVDKGIALDMLAKHLNICSDEIIAVGDNYNDIEMLKYAGLGVAMGNAQEDVKKIADFITTSNDESGFANAVFENLCSAEQIG